MTEEEWKAINIRSKIMAMMLNGSIDWNKGSDIRNMGDEDLIAELGEAYDKDEQN